MTFLKKLPNYLVANVGGLRIGVIHGDPLSLAGSSVSKNNSKDGSFQSKLWNLLMKSFESLWEFRQVFEQLVRLKLNEFTTEKEVVQFLEEANVDGFASTHTSLPFAQVIISFTPQ